MKFSSPDKIVYCDRIASYNRHNLSGRNFRILVSCAIQEGSDNNRKKQNYVFSFAHGNRRRNPRQKRSERV